MFSGIVIKEMQTNTTEVLQYTYNKAKSIKRLIVPSVGKSLKQLELAYIVNGNVTGTTTLENSLEVSTKIWQGK